MYEISHAGRLFPGWGVIPQLMQIKFGNEHPATWWHHSLGGCLDWPSLHPKGSCIKRQCWLTHVNRTMALLHSTADKRTSYCRVNWVETKVKVDGIDMTRGIYEERSNNASSSLQISLFGLCGSLDAVLKVSLSESAATIPFSMTQVRERGWVKRGRGTIWRLAMQPIRQPLSVVTEDQTNIALPVQDVEMGEKQDPQLVDSHAQPD